MPCPPDAFGDRFDLDKLPLPRSGGGYAVQYLGSDTLLDCQRNIFLPVRNPSLKALFDSFDAAFAAAENWMATQSGSLEEHPLAIVPAYFDNELQRHVLIHGVLSPSPEWPAVTLVATPDNINSD